MTNKTERYFIVSESELEAVLTSVWKDACEWYGVEVRPGVPRDEAEAACRARPVPDEATHFALFDEDRPYYTPDDHEAWVTTSWRIEK